MQSELWTDQDHRATGVIPPLSQKVLPEASGFPLQHVAKRLERPPVLTGDRPSPPTVVKQGVDSLLQHALLVANDHIRGAEFHKPLETVVAVDHATIEIVEIGSGKSTSVQRYKRAQIRRDHRDHPKDHPFRTVPRVFKGVNYF